MTKHPTPPKHFISPDKPVATGKPRTIGWSIGHPWLRKYDGEPRAASLPEILPNRELADEMA